MGVRSRPEPEARPRSRPGRRDLRGSVGHDGDRRVVLTIEDVTDLAFLASQVERRERAY